MPNSQQAGSLSLQGQSLLQAPSGGTASSGWGRSSLRNPGILNDTLGTAVPLQVRVNSDAQPPQPNNLLSVTASFVHLLQAHQFAHTSNGLWVVTALPMLHV